MRRPVIRTGGPRVKSPHTQEYRFLINTLVSARKAAGITQQMLASQLGRPQSFVAKVESRERRIDVIEFLAITRVLGIDPCNIIQQLNKMPITGGSDNQ